jgi:hypothetical protein
MVIKEQVNQPMSKEILTIGIILRMEQKVYGKAKTDQWSHNQQKIVLLKTD